MNGFGSKACALCAIAGGALIGANALRSGYQRRISNEIDQLFAVGGNASRALVSARDFKDLPDPVKRWLSYSRIAGKERPVSVRLKQTGEFRTSENGQWMPFTAEEYFTTDPPGYIWRAKMQAAPLISIEGRDRYLDGRASIDMRLLSLVPVARSSATKLSQGALLRYLNEIMWFPAAALSWYIDWEAIDEHSAKATIRWNSVTATAIFSFDDEGRITNMTANRYNDQRGCIQPWSTPIDGYGELGGLCVPVSGTGVWNYESGDFPYIRLRVTDLEANRPLRYS